MGLIKRAKDFAGRKSFIKNELSEMGPGDPNGPHGTVESQNEG